MELLYIFTGAHIRTGNVGIVDARGGCSNLLRTLALHSLHKPLIKRANEYGSYFNSLEFLIKATIRLRD